MSNLIALFDRLFLYDNQLTFLPDYIGRLTNLQVYGIQSAIRFQLILMIFFDRLSLGTNQLSSIPDSIGQLINLNVYDIQFVISCQISSLSLKGSFSAIIS